jgi:hypothetical protein
VEELLSAFLIIKTGTLLHAAVENMASVGWLDDMQVTWC